MDDLDTGVYVIWHYDSAVPDLVCIGEAYVQMMLERYKVAHPDRTYRYGSVEQFGQHCYEVGLNDNY